MTSSNGKEMCRLCIRSNENITQELIFATALRKNICSLIARFMGPTWGQHGAHLGPVVHRWGPGRPHEPCYLGILFSGCSKHENPLLTGLSGVCFLASGQSYHSQCLPSNSLHLGFSINATHFLSKLLVLLYASLVEPCQTIMTNMPFNSTKVLKTLCGKHNIIPLTYPQNRMGIMRYANDYLGRYLVIHKSIKYASKTTTQTRAWFTLKNSK